VAELADLGPFWREVGTGHILAIDDVPPYHSELSHIRDIALNPFFTVLFDICHKYEWEIELRRSNSSITNSRRTGEFLDYSSFDKMQLTSPPVTRIMLESDEGEWPYNTNDVKGEGGNGVTLGQVVRACREIIGPAAAAAGGRGTGKQTVVALLGLDLFVGQEVWERCSYWPEKCYCFENDEEWD
jgi:hypothetical protein